MTHPMLAQIPSDLLLRATGIAESGRSVALVAWLEARDYRPLLIELEQERARRVGPNTRPNGRAKRTRTTT